MHDVIKRCQAIGLGRFDDAVKNRTSIGSTCCVAKQPILFANYKGLDGSFGAVVINSKISIIDIANQFVPLIQAVANGFTQCCFGWYLQSRFIQPGFILVEQGK